ncbi:hypothetical protein K502DRAFT_340985 [Neoconidiobolus thromboides FSU 785]|nr:hypothetical protein K502DRAFT_340985 [Neoconidiobolus thromboides FSU 785]
MDITKAKKLPPCPTCGSTRYRKTGLGFFLCEEGHQLEGFRQEVMDFMDDNFIGTEKRRRVAVKNKKIISKIYYNEKGKFLYLRAYQTILKKQSNILIEQFGVPKELLQIVQGLWKVYVSMNPYIQVNVKKLRKKKMKKENLEDEDDLLKELEGSSSDEDSERHIDELLKNNLDSENESDTDLNKLEDIDIDIDIEKEENALKKPESPIKRQFIIKLYWTLTFQYLALMYLKVPILSVDLLRLCNNNKIPFNNARSTLPLKIQNRLRPSTALLARVPSFNFFQEATNLMAELLFPNLNVPPPTISLPFISYSILEHFNLPITFYPMIVTLKNKLNIKLNLPIRKTDKERRYSPEVIVMGLIVIILKLFYGLDGKDRLKHELFSNLPDIFDLLDNFKASNEHLCYQFIPSKFSLSMEMLQHQPIKYNEFAKNTVLPLGLKGYKDYKQIQDLFLEIVTSSQHLIKESEFTALLTTPISKELKNKIEIQISNIKYGQDYFLFDKIKELKFGANLPVEYFLLIKYLAKFSTDGDWLYLFKTVVWLENKLMGKC